MERTMSKAISKTSKAKTAASKANDSKIAVAVKDVATADSGTVRVGSWSRSV